jgi:response regulator RpfG family c-di-GMP phosphodiesterase
MPFVSSNQLSDAEAEDYMRVFHATVNVLTNAVVVFDARSRTDPDPAERQRCRGAALEANRQLQLVQAKLAAVMSGTAQVRAPTQAEVSTAQGLTQKLAEQLAVQAKAAALVKIVSKAVATFGKINAPDSPAPGEAAG